MLLHDDIVTYGETEASAFPGRFGRKERIKYLVFDFRRNANSVVADPDLHAVAKAFRRGGKGGLVVFTVRRSFVPRCVNPLKSN